MISFLGFGYKAIINKQAIIPHNDFLGVFFQNGLIALISFIIFWESVIRSGLKNLFIPTSTLLLSIVFASIVTSFTTNYFVNVRVGILVGIYIGVLLKLKEIYSQVEATHAA